MSVRVHLKLLEMRLGNNYVGDLETENDKLGLHGVMALGAYECKLKTVKCAH